MHSNHMHLNFYVFYRIDYKLLLAGGSAYNTSTESGSFTFDVNGHITNTWWANGSAYS